MSALAHEIDECANAVARLAAHGARVQAFVHVREYVKTSPAMVCARGSSGNACLYLRQIVETRLRLPVAG